MGEEFDIPSTGTAADMVVFLDSSMFAFTCVKLNIGRVVSFNRKPT